MMVMVMILIHVGLDIYAVTVPTASIVHEPSRSIRMIATATGDFLTR
jgi:hypothetical protein